MKKFLYNCIPWFDILSEEFPSLSLCWIRLNSFGPILCLLGNLKIIWKWKITILSNLDGRSVRYKSLIIVELMKGYFFLIFFREWLWKLQTIRVGYCIGFVLYSVAEGSKQLCHYTIYSLWIIGGAIWHVSCSLTVVVFMVLLLAR